MEEKKIVFVIKDKLAREEWELPIEELITLREFVTSEQFLHVTKINPNKASFYVNGVAAEDDLHLLAGDEVTMFFPSSKYAISSRELRKKLKKIFVRA